jgi:hypothetical protein
MIGETSSLTNIMLDTREVARNGASRKAVEIGSGKRVRDASHMLGPTPEASGVTA